MTGPRRRVPTRALLIGAAFAAVQAVLFLAVVPMMTALAATSPPGYAVVASVYSLMPMLARLVTGVRGMAIFTGAVAGLLTSAVSPIGPLSAVPMVVAGAVFDLLMPRTGREDRTGRAHRTVRVLLAAAAVGAALFLVSLPVFSPEHLVPAVLVATLIARLAGELAVATVALVVHRMLLRAGVMRR